MESWTCNAVPISPIEFCYDGPLRLGRSERNGRFGACAEESLREQLERRVRQVIADELATVSPVAGEIEVDESTVFSCTVIALRDCSGFTSILLVAFQAIATVSGGAPGRPDAAGARWRPVCGGWVANFSRLGRRARRAPVFSACHAR